MKRKKFLKAVAELLRRPIMKVLFYLAGMVLVLGLSGAFSDGQTIVKTFLNIVTSEETITLFFAGLFSLGVAKILSWFDSYMEESMKTEDNHHKIITQYNKHKLGLTHYEESFADKHGVFLILKHVRKKELMKKPEAPSKNAPKKEQQDYKKCLRRWEREIARRNSEKDNQSKEYQLLSQSVEQYLSGELGLCSLNMFANVAQDTTVRFEDSPEEHELPSFVIAHADELLQAHKTSAKNNKNTIRLNDFAYDGKTLTLNTARSTYYHMLITNRCMDYQFANGMSIREVYEYENEICPIQRSKFGNQIGINGLIVTSDNYILVEKRGRKKITWKNKFAQSISLAMKTDDLGLSRRDTLANDCQTAEDKLKGVIQKTIKSNFGLTPADYQTFQMEDNFLGLARDLLEGGKPNLYFYVRTNCTAAELQKKLEENVRVTQANNKGKSAEEKKTVISTSKLDSDYYLIPFENIEIDFYYRLFVDRRTALKVHRKLHPRCGRLTEFWDKAKEKNARIWKPVLVRECGEALLVTLAYLELRWEWLQSQKKGEQSDEK